LSNQTTADAPGAGYSIEEAAAAIRLSYVTVYRRVRTGEWPGGQVGRKWLVSCTFIDALAEAISTRPQVNAKAFAAEWMARSETPAPAGAVA
jgi:excisionase family DNA binding protein